MPLMIYCPGSHKVWGFYFPMSSGLLAEIAQVNGCRNRRRANYRPRKGRGESVVKETAPK